MKPILFLAIITFFGCATTQPTSTSIESKQAEEKRQEVVENPNQQFLAHNADESFLAQPQFAWFSSNKANYTPDQVVIEKLKPLFKDIDVKVFMGTWCGDSKRETPRFYKIMDALEVKPEHIALVTVNTHKKTDDGLEEGFNVIRVPTFIFYKDGKEINRIVEYPKETLEKDMLAILSGETYKHSYEN